MRQVMKTATAILMAVLLCGCGQAKPRVMASVDGLGLATASLAWVQTHPEPQAKVEPLGVPQVIHELAKAVAEPAEPEPVKSAPVESVDEQPIEVPIQPEPQEGEARLEHVNPPLMQSSGNLDERYDAWLLTQRGCPPCPGAKAESATMPDFRFRYSDESKPLPAFCRSTPTVWWKDPYGRGWQLPWPGADKFRKAHAKTLDPSYYRPPNPYDVPEHPQAAQGRANPRRHKANQVSKVCPMAADTTIHAKDVVNQAFDLIGTGEVKMNSWYSVAVPAATKVELSRDKQTIGLKVHGNAYPQLKLHAAGLGYTANITGAKLTRDTVTIQIASFPDVTFSVESLDK